MNFILAAFVAGVAGYHLFPYNPDPHWLFVLLGLPLIWRYVWLRWFGGLLLGLSWSCLYVTLQLSTSLPPTLEGKDLILTGTVVDLPVQRGHLSRFELVVSDLEPRQPGFTIPKRVRLSWYGAGVSLKPGEVWHLQVRLKRPHGLLNPGGFDYARWLFRNGIQATGYVRNWQGNQRIEDASRGGWLDRQRLQIATQIGQRLTDPDAAALFRALGIGDRSGLSDQTWELFTRTGTNHLVAISGLHIGMVAGLVFFLGRWFWGRSERLTLKLPTMQAAAWLALGAAAGYAALAGFSLPTQRALAMLGLGMGGLLLGRSLSLSRSFLLALCGVVVIDPMAPLSSSFWLSFAAVGVILLAGSGRLRTPRGWRQWGRVQWVVTIGLAPMLFLLFNQASLIAPLANLVLVPWYSLVLVPLVLLSIATLALPLPQDFLLNSTATLLEQTLRFMYWLAQSPYALVHRPDLPVSVWLIGCLGVLLLLLPRGMPGRALGVLLVAPMLFNNPQRPPARGALFTLLDVGQGLSCVIETAQHVLIYDTGPAYASGFISAEAVLIPYLRSRGIERVDRLILSNADRDHASGVEALVSELKITRVFSGETLAQLPTEKCQAGVAWNWDGVHFRILHPFPGDRFSDSNNASCVLQVETDTDRLLIPGDVEREAEQLLVARHGDLLRTDILVAPHHGSNTSSTQRFVARVRPDFVLFPTGYGNRFGFPKAAVMERWQNTGARLLNNAETGAIQFWLGSDKLVPELYRENHPATWRADRQVQ